MYPAPVYAQPKASARRLESLRDLPLRDLEDVEASMMRVTAASLIEQALTWGSARAQFHGYQLEARREGDAANTLVSLCIRCGVDVVVKEHVVLSQAARDAARRQRH
jgi:hypothetical protein